MIGSSPSGSGDSARGVNRQTVSHPCWDGRVLQWTNPDSLQVQPYYYQQLRFVQVRGQEDLDLNLAWLACAVQSSTEIRFPCEI